MTTREAAREVREKLAEYGLRNKVTAQRVGFSDLARARVVFVTVHDWKVDCLNDATPACVDALRDHSESYIVHFKGKGIIG